MVSDGIKAAQIQAQYSPLINSTWGASSTPTANALAAIRHAAARLNPRWRGRRPAVLAHPVRRGPGAGRQFQCQARDGSPPGGHAAGRGGGRARPQSSGGPGCLPRPAGASRCAGLAEING